MTGQDIEGDYLEFILTSYPEDTSGEDFVDCGLITDESDNTTVICEGDEDWFDELGNGQYDFGEDFIDTKEKIEKM